MTERKYAGADWVASMHYGKNMSEIGRAVADLLGDTFAGIYHLPPKALAKAPWSDPQCIDVAVYGEMATIDFDYLTRLIILAHDRMIRVGLRGRGPGYLHIFFHQREQREGTPSERYPTIEDHIAVIRKEHGGPKQ